MHGTIKYFQHFISAIPIYLFVEMAGKGLQNLYPMSIYLHRVIRLTSPKLNYFSISGSILMYLSVFFQLLPTTHKTMFHSQCIVSPGAMISLD